MTKAKCALGILVSLLAVSFVAEAEEIGRVDLKGRSIVVDSNGTWKYADEAPAGAAPSATCAANQLLQSKKLPVSLCLQSGWRLMPTPAESMEFEAVQTDKDIYVGLITERTTMLDGAVREAILYNAASATNVKVADVPVVLEEKRKIGDEDWNYIVYDVSFSGAPFRFANYYKSLGDKGAVQLVFWSSKSYFEEDRVLQDAVANTLVLKQ